MKVLCSICIVDDSEDYRQLLQFFFKRNYPLCSVYVFRDGKSLLDELPHISNPVGLILMDRHMSGLDGLQTLTHLKREPAYQTIPIVMMSGDATPSEVQVCYRAGVNSFVLKGPGSFSSMEALTLISQYWLSLNQYISQE